MELEESIKTNLHIDDGPKILFIEPFYGGSHKVLINSLIKEYKKCTLVTLSAKKWHWRARCGALMLYNLIPPITTEKVLFCSSVLNLAELLGIRPDLQKLRKIVYFHENQFVYPVRTIKERDIQYAYNQINTCLAADVVLFNSNFNKSAFFDNFGKILQLIPDCNSKNLKDQIINKCRVLYFPVEFPVNITKKPNLPFPIRIVWPHRWEFDKNPALFFDILINLKQNGANFKVSVIGEQFSDNPEIFDKAKKLLENEIIHFSFVENKKDYYDILNTSHIVVSTAEHEFFGVSMLEAAYCGCFPLAPNKLVYPEIYPPQCLYKNSDDLFEKLKKFCDFPNLLIQERSNLNINFTKFSANTLIPQYLNIFHVCNNK